MNVRNCKKCGKVFNYIVGLPICPRCKEEQENIFQNVKEYVREHPGSDIMEVSKECNVEPGQIKQWIRESRLQFADDSPIKIPCEKCGVLIRCGRFCDRCNAELIGGFNEVSRNINSKQEQPLPEKRRVNEKDKMRYL